MEEYQQSDKAILNPGAVFEFKSYHISGFKLFIAFCQFIHLVPNYSQLLRLMLTLSKQYLPGLPFVLSA